MMNPTKIIYNSAYVEYLKAQGNHKKAQAFMIYLHDINLGIYETSRAYSPRWNIGKTTAHHWMKEFDSEIDKAERDMF